MIRILVPLDGSPLAEQALYHAAAIARSFKTELHLLQVVVERPNGNGFSAGSSDLRLRAAEAASYLRQVADRLAEQGVSAKTTVAQGRAAQEIIAYADDNDVNLIALTAFGAGGVTEFVHGSTVHKVISRAGVSILLIRPQQHAEPVVRYRKLLVPLDGSYQSDWALCLATSIARAHEGELMVMQVVESPRGSTRLPASDTERELTDRLLDIRRSEAAHHLRELETQLPKDLAFSSRVVVADEASRVIEDMAQTEDIGLLVLSAHGVGRADCWLYGPVPETLLAHSTRPLLVLQDNFSADNIELEPLGKTVAVHE